MLRYDIGTATDIGHRETNEDRFVVLDLGQGAWVVAVADGLGGHLAGEVASGMAADLLAEKARTWKLNRPPEKVADAIEDTLRLVHARIRRKARWNKTMEGMATTMTCALLRCEDVVHRYAGDSALFWSRQDRLLYRTVPHLYDDKLISCLGGPGTLRVSPQRSTEYDWHLKVKPGDTLVLCSDGLLHTLAEPTLLRMYGEASTAAELASTLVQAALKAGESDNITVVSVRVQAAEDES